MEGVLKDTQKGKTRFVVLHGKMPPIVHLNTVSHSVILSLSNIYIYMCQICLHLVWLLQY